MLAAAMILSACVTRRGTVKVCVVEPEAGSFHWVLVETVSGRRRQLEMSEHQFMTRDGARTEGGKVLRSMRRRQGPR
jgi:hypothetical protein